MFDHVKFGVSDDAASKAFYLEALAPLGVVAVSEGPPSYGIELSAGGNASLCRFETAEKPAHLHLAFTAANREQVEAFHRAALATGATAMVRPACVGTITVTISRRSSSVRTGTTSKSVPRTRSLSVRAGRPIQPATQRERDAAGDCFELTRR